MSSVELIYLGVDMSRVCLCAGVGGVPDLRYPSSALTPSGDDYWNAL